jgi:hypothetical protein
MVVVLFCALCRLIWMGCKLTDFFYQGHFKVSKLILFFKCMSEATIDGRLFSFVKLSSFFLAFDATAGFIF